MPGFEIKTYSKEVAVHLPQNLLTETRTNRDLETQVVPLNRNRVNDPRPFLEPLMSSSLSLLQRAAIPGLLILRSPYARICGISHTHPPVGRMLACRKCVKRHPHRELGWYVRPCKDGQRNNSNAKCGPSNKQSADTHIPCEIFEVGQLCR